MKQCLYMQTENKTVQRVSKNGINERSSFKKKVAY